MKYILIFLLSICINISSQAQAPQGIPYQGFLRNGSGAIICYSSVSIRFSIHDSSAAIPGRLLNLSL